MTQRVEGGSTYTQTFDTKNQLTSILVSSQTTQFLYDPDGNLVKKINPDGSKTLYVGGIYEVNKNSGGTVTGTKTYYPVAGAMRVGGTLYYMLKDHLGSASVLTNNSGTFVAGADVRYYPFGEARSNTTPMLTDKLFTGQREITGLGIYHYGARFYSPKLGRFLSTDTIVPSYANPQSLNRFSYVVNNPLRYTDPTGHRYVEGDFEGSLKAVEEKMTKKWKADNKKRKAAALWRVEQRRLLASATIGGPCVSIMCVNNSESTLDIPLDPSLQHLQSTSPTFHDEFDNLVSQIEFGVNAMDLLDLVEDGIQWGRPAYKQIKYAIPLGGYEYAIDGALQAYDDMNMNLTPGQRYVRGVLRAGESAITDGLSIAVGSASAAALQASVPIPGVSAGVGYVVGSYSTSAILDSIFVNQVNPYLSNRFLGGP